MAQETGDLHCTNHWSSPSLQCSQPHGATTSCCSTDVALGSGCHSQGRWDWTAEGLVALQEPSQEITQVRGSWGGLCWDHGTAPSIPGCSGNALLGFGHLLSHWHSGCAAGPLLLLQCGLQGSAWTRGGDYSQAEMMAIRESGLHLAALRARLSNSCFNQWNCEILQLP